MNKFVKLLILLCFMPSFSLLAADLFCSETLEDSFSKNDESRCLNEAPPSKIRLIFKPSELEERRIKISLGYKNIQRHIEGKRTLHKPTGLSPKGKSFQSFLTGSPLKYLACPKVSLLTKRGRDTQEEAAEVITSGNSNFTSGKWAYLDYFVPSDTIVIDSDFPAFAQVANKIATHIANENLTNIHQILPYLIKAFYDNFSLMLPGISCLKDHEIYCIHYSSLALPLVSHLLNHRDFPFTGSIHFLGADVLMKGMKFGNQEGHAWNYLHLEDEKTGGVHYIMLDFLHRKYVVADKTNRALKDMMVKTVNKDTGEIDKIDSLKKNALQYDWMRCTKRRFFASKDMDRKYNNKNTREIVALKMVPAKKTIEEISTLECQ